MGGLLEGGRLGGRGGIRIPRFFPLAALVVLALVVVPTTTALTYRYVPEVHRGVVGGGLPPVSYPIAVSAGERIVVAAHMMGPGVKVQLFDPTERVREVMVLTPADRFELNAETGGVWRLEVSSVLATSAGYTLIVTVAPNYAHGLDEGLEAGDAPSSCAGAHLIRNGVWPGGLWGSDTKDVYRISASRGDAVVAVLKPDELDDGADFSIQLLNATCNLVAGENFGPGAAKSAPDLGGEIPVSRTGTYYLRVERVDGVGNYLLALAVSGTFPTLPWNDAGAERDSVGSADAIPLRAPAAYQAQFHDGDAFDWYRVSRAPGTTLKLVVQPSYGSVFEVQAYDASSTLLASAIDDGPLTFNVAYDAGPVFWRMRALVGGGNYMMALAEQPSGT